MRCLSCNKKLNSYEATRKSFNTNDYLDLCNSCFRTVKDDIIAISRSDLEHAADDYELNNDWDNVDTLDEELYNSDEILEFKLR